MSPSLIAFFWSAAYQSLAISIGKPKYFLFSTVGASLLHYTLAYILGVKYGLNIVGVAIASNIHFIARFLIIYSLILKDEESRKCLIPLRHEDSFIDLREIFKVGYDSFVNRVMGWWAFDVYT